ncbi:MAG: hypothetical protein AABZ39_11700 [Spirochaetota bacterium]
MLKRISLATIAACMAVSMAQAIEIKLGSELHLRYTAKWNASDMSNTYNGFSAERGYISIEPKFSDTVSGRFTMDFAAPSDKAASGELKGTLKFKYAYLSIATPLPDSKIEFGWIKHYMGGVYDWNYDFIDKQLGDKYKFYKSADAGIVFLGLLPEGFGEYNVWLVNGEGYEVFGTGIDRIPEAGANIRVIPLPGLTVGLNCSYTHSSSPRFYNFNDGLERFVYGALLQYKMGPLTLFGEYIGSQFPGAAGDPSAVTTASAAGPSSSVKIWNAFSVSAFGELAKIIDGLNVDAGVKYDLIAKNVNATNANGQEMALTAQVNYNFTPDKTAVVQLAYVADVQATSDSMAFAIRNHTVQLQLKAKFSGTIVK